MEQLWNCIFFPIYIHSVNNLSERRIQTWKSLGATCLTASSILSATHFAIQKVYMALNAWTTCFHVQETIFYFIQTLDFGTCWEKARMQPKLIRFVPSGCSTTSLQHCLELEKLIDPSWLVSEQFEVEDLNSIQVLPTSKDSLNFILEYQMRIVVLERISTM